MVSPGLRTVRLSGTDSAPRWRGRLHLVAAVAAVPAAAAIAWRRPTPAIAFYGVALFGLFAVSAGYHLLPVSARTRQILRRADHVMIYLYMAAAYTPWCLYAVGGTLGWVVLGASWAGVAAGIGVKLAAFERARTVSGVLYGAIGSLAVVTLPAAFSRMGGAGIGLLVATGALYAGGVLTLAARRPDPAPAVFGYHEVWHAAVVAAGACYFALIWSVAAG